MTAPVLTDLAGRNFTEGDFVVYSSVNGIRYGKVGWIRDLSVSNLDRRFKVYIELDFHHGLDKLPGKMYAKRQGYEYVPKHFLKVTELTST